MRARLLLWSVVLAANLTSAGGAVTDFSANVPAKVGPWEAEGKDRVFDQRTLYDYLDGGAEVYLAFDFRRAWVRRYAAPGGREMNLDIYEMGSPAGLLFAGGLLVVPDAFSLFILKPLPKR